MENIYLDHAATTPMNPEVIDTMSEVLKNHFGNPSSVHSFGRDANEELMQARKTIAQTLNVKEHEIIFTSGGTESDNTAIIGTALYNQERGKHLITTAIEHPAVLEPMKYLEKQYGFRVTYLPVNEQGEISLTDFKNALDDETTLVSIMYGNNEVGTLMPIKEIGEILKDHPAVFHTDAVQAYGLETIHPHELGVDMLSVSGHKFNGPKGVGFLYKNDNIHLPRFMRGGEQEEKRRAGTENLAGIVGMAKAISLLPENIREEKKAQYRKFQKIVTDTLDAAEVRYHVNGNLENNLAHVLNLWIEGVNSNLLLMSLDLKGVAISTGSACTAGNIEPSHVIQAMRGVDSPAVNETVRFSFGLNNTEEQVKYAADELVNVAKRFQK